MKDVLVKRNRIKAGLRLSECDGKLKSRTAGIITAQKVPRITAVVEIL